MTSRLQVATNARLRITDNMVSFKGAEKKEDDECCPVTSLCYIKYLKAINHNVAIPMY